MKKIKLSEIKLDQRNANKHSVFGMGLLNKSISQNGVIEAITISNDNVAISGNARTEEFASTGFEDSILIESDGTKPIIIKRTDIQSDTKEFYNAALAANIVAQKNIVMDAETVDAIAEEYELSEWAEMIDGIISPIIINDINLPDNDKASFVVMRFTLKNTQALEIIKAIKISKQIYKDEFNEDNLNSNGNALYHIVLHFLKMNDSL